VKEREEEGKTSGEGRMESRGRGCWRRRTGRRRSTQVAVVALASLLLSAVSCEWGSDPNTPGGNGPAAPGSLGASAGDGHVVVTWGAVSGAASYFVYYAAGATVSKTGTRAVATGTTYDVTGLTNGTQYAFAVSSYDGTDESGLSGVATATPTGGVGVPGTPGGVEAKGGNGSVTVSWPSVSGATGYNVYWSQGTAVTTVSSNRVANAVSPAMIGGLSNGTEYAFAVSAVNTAGESGLSGVKTARPGGAVATGDTVRDIEGNVYHTVTIGTQVWMAENLKTTKYRDGTAIALVTDSAAWAELTTPAYCWYNNDIANKATYGALYNWYAVNTGKLAPAGWHVPSDTEWVTLTNYLGGRDVAGGKLKEAGTAHWEYPNEAATNSTGFSALPGGYRVSNGAFYGIGSYGNWWSASATDASFSWGRRMYHTYANVYRNDYYVQNGFSVRCVRDRD